MTMITGYGDVNPQMHHIVRVYCDVPGPFHEKYGKTWLATFARDVHGETGWREVQPTSRRVRRREDAHRASLTREDEDRIIRDGWTPPDRPFQGTTHPGVRPPSTTYLRGDTPATEDGQRHIAEALSTGQRNSAAGPQPARPEDLAGRAKLDVKRCRCGEPRFRERGEIIWPIFDRLIEQGKHGEVSTRLLRHAAEQARRASG